MHAAAVRAWPTEVTSFGYRHGVPAESDLVFDVRFLHYIPAFKKLTGKHPSVARYIRSPQTQEFVNHISDLLVYRRRSTNPGIRRGRRASERKRFAKALRPACKNAGYIVAGVSGIAVRPQVRRLAV